MAEPRSVVITGASRGLGFASAVRLYRDGWRVVAAMRTPDKGMPLLRQATGAAEDDDRLIGVQLDLTDIASVAAAAKSIEEAVGAPYGLVHNAGIYPAGMVEETPISVWESTFATGIFGPVALTKALLPSMRKAGRGRIVLLSSAAGVRGMAITATYSAVKGALERWGESMAVEVASFGIGVTILVTGAYDTEILTDAGMIDVRDLDGPYAPHHNIIDKRGLHALTQRMAKPPEKFAVSLAKSLDDTSPFARRAVGVDARMLLIANRVLPSAGMHQMTRLMMGFPRFGALRGGAAPLTMSQRALMFAATKLPAPVMARIATLMVKFGPKPATTTAPTPESENHG
jgi:NAD(P)-dependent dehydrogenase (short-subunit alcohol dehydrogenase family)